MQARLTILSGDGIGPEVTAWAVRILDAVAEKFGHSFAYEYADLGGVAYEKFGTPLPQETIDACNRADAVLLGAVGGKKWDTLSVKLRPEQGLLGIRAAMGVFANLRPAAMFSALKEASPLQSVQAGILPDLMIVRELTGGIYFGKRGTETVRGIRRAHDEMAYTEAEIERVGRVAFDLAMRRRKKLCSVDKANVLDCSRLWRDVMHSLAREYPEVKYSDLYVDNCAMQLIHAPASFDVIVTGNLFGDILSDEAAMLTGSIGMLPSASLRGDGFGIYEPVHGSAPDIAGKNAANPSAAILSAAMLLRYSLHLPEEAAAIEAAVAQTLSDGFRTADLAGNGEKPCTCMEFGDAVLDNLLAHSK